MTYIRAFTVRGLGRIEQRSLIPIIAPALDDSAAEVRSAAADAVAQAASAAVVGSPASTDARALLTRHLQLERDPAVRAALLEAIGRLSQGGSVAQVQATASIIAPSLASTSPVERRGAIRGIFFLSQKREARAPGVIPTDVTDRVFAMLTEKSPADLTATERVNLAAILASAVAMNDARSLALFAHSDPYVRDAAVGALARATDTATVRSILERAMKDPAPIVRFRSVGVYARRLRASDGCAPLIRLARDRDMTVALAAVDALSGCRSDAVAVRLLDSLAGTFRNGDAWHLPTHAFVALSTVDPRRAHEMMPIFAQAQSFFRPDVRGHGGAADERHHRALSPRARHPAERARVSHCWPVEARCSCRRLDLPRGAVVRRQSAPRGGGRGAHGNSGYRGRQGGRVRRVEAARWFRARDAPRRRDSADRTDEGAACRYGPVGVQAAHARSDSDVHRPRRDRTDGGHDRDG